MNTEARPGGQLEPIVGRQCDQLILDGPFGYRNCANKPIAGDTLCKRHRSMAEASGYHRGKTLPPNTGDNPRAASG